MIYSLKEVATNSLPIFSIRDESLVFIAYFTTLSCSFVRHTGKCLAHKLAHFDWTLPPILRGDVLPITLMSIIKKKKKLKIELLLIKMLWALLVL